MLVTVWGRYMFVDLDRVRHRPTNSAQLDEHLNPFQMSFEAIENFTQPRVSSGTIPGCVLTAVTATGESYIHRAVTPPSPPRTSLRSTQVLSSGSPAFPKSSASLEFSDAWKAGFLASMILWVGSSPNSPVVKSLLQRVMAASPWSQENSSITLRHLLNHTSGLDIDFVHPLLQAWQASRGERPMFVSGHVFNAHEGPLTFHPGEGLSYGGGVDYALYAATRASGCTSPEGFLREKGSGPLGDGVNHISPEKHPETMKRLVPPLVRQEDGTLRPGPSGYPYQQRMEQGPLAYIRPLLMCKRSCKTSFGPQFSSDARPLQELIEKIPLLGQMCGVLKADGINMAIGGLLFEQGDDEFHRERTLT
ncbi:hypothetical protein ACJZ2D_011160 [Fusarium nematophilum]